MNVIEIAKSYIGETEKPNNAGFNDQLFQKKMEEVGFIKGQAWCSYFAELCFKEANQKDWWKLEALFNASAVKTFDNFKKAEYKISDKPFVGALVIWQQQKAGKPQWQGHAGIVVEASGDTFKSVEGNTNDGGGREGYIVALKNRKVQKVTNGLQTLGFIKI